MLGCGAPSSDSSEGTEPSTDGGTTTPATTPTGGGGTTPTTSPTTTATTTPTTSPTTTTSAPTTTTTPTTTTRTGDALWVPAEIIGVANVDDDDGDGVIDLGRSDMDLDLEILTVYPSLDGTGVAELRFTLDDPTGQMQIWYDGAPALHAGAQQVTVPFGPDPVELLVEFGGFNLEALFEVAEIDASGGVLASAESVLLGAPLILNHHLQQTEAVWAVHVTGGFTGDNTRFIDGYTDAIDGLFSAVPGAAAGNDVWMQDEFEWSTATSPGNRLDVVIDSIRDRGLDSLNFLGPDVAQLTWGSGWATTYDSFGNLEVSPPLTADGVEYPYGRIYWGGKGAADMHGDMTSFLSDQTLQAPFRVDTTWLCVGHVDEFMSFVPDSTAPKGFRFVYADIDAGWEVLESMDPDLSLTKYAPRSSGHDIDNVRHMLEDGALRAYNEGIKRDHLEPILAQMKDELDLEEEDIIYMPSLFEAPGYCGSLAAALIPGMANLVVSNEPGVTKVFMADPFLRVDVSDQSTDEMIAVVESIMPAELELHFLDDWEVFHKGLGEVHCGTNNRRTPVADWWTL